MSNAKPQTFIDITYEELHKKIEEYDADGWRFVNICGSTVEGGVELIYSFSKGLPMDNLRFTLANGVEIPSVSDCFPNAFFFENETHDLFGVKFSGISIDFDGEFYTVSVPTPMNPHSTQAQAADADDTYGAANYGACDIPLVAPSVILSEAKDPAGDVRTDTDVAPSTPPSVILSEAKDPAEDVRTSTDVAASTEGGEA